MTKKRILQWALKVAVSVGLIVYLVQITEKDQLIEKFKTLSFGFVLVAWVYYSLCQLLSAYRWQLFLSVKGIDIPLKKLFSFYMVGMFLNNFIPGAVGGDVVKAYDLYKSTQQAEIAVTSVFLERFTGLVGLGIIAVVAALVGFQKVQSPLIWFLVISTALFLVTAILCIWHDGLSRRCVGLLGWLMPSRVSEKFEKFHLALHSYKFHPRTMLLAVLLSVILQLLFAFYYVIAAEALKINLDIFYFILFLPIVTIVTMLPLSIGGLGIREAILVLLFAQVNIASADILSISLTVHVINTVLSCWGGIILLVRKPVSAGAMIS
jgi:uncharacterized protein (TIRG00374 family)